jgi:hypothetical protein
VVGQWLVQIVADVPAHREAVRDHPHEPPLAPQPLEEHDELELEEDHRIHGRPAAPGVKRGDELPHEREVQRLLQPAVEVVHGDQVLEREVAG